MLRYNLVNFKMSENAGRESGLLEALGRQSANYLSWLTEYRVLPFYASQGLPRLRIQTEVQNTTVKWNNMIASFIWR